MDNQILTKVGIREIGCYIPNLRVSNFDKMEQFDIDQAFLENKIGIKTVAKKDNLEETSDMCVKAVEALLVKSDLSLEMVDCLVVVTQNPDKYGLPHTSSIVHKKMSLKKTCAVFDLSLGCSGFVYGLSVIESFMAVNGLSNGILITCDPYSKIVSDLDKNTSLLFGDAATATLISSEPRFVTKKFLFGSYGQDGSALEVNDGVLYMDGRAVFNFSATEVPKQVLELVDAGGYLLNDFDLFLFHQGSKYIIDTLIKRLKINKDKVPFKIENIGNTTSSSIPLLLSEFMNDNTKKNILMSGFGVGLSWSSCILQRV